MTQRKPDEPLDPVVLAELLGGVVPETPPAGLRARVLERVRTATSMNAATLRADEGAWKSVVEGIDVKTLLYDKAGGTVSFLLRAQAGASMPEHGHRAHEECLVLQGEFIIGDVTLRAGDFQAGHPGETHPPAYTRTGVLLYLRGSTEDYPFACP